MGFCLDYCFGDTQGDGDETQPLLAQYDDETALQRTLHEKLHTYLMLRALSRGYLPSTKQAIVNLRALLASRPLNPDAEVTNELSPAGKHVLRLSRRWLEQLIELVRHKNDGDIVQEFIWYLTKSRVELDTDDMLNAASRFRPKADASAAYESAKVVGSLLFGNRDFRLFLADLSVIARQVFSDTVATVSEVAEKVAEQAAPTDTELEGVKHPGQESIPPVSPETVSSEVTQVGDVVRDGIVKTAQEAGHSTSEHLTGGEKQTLLFRLKQAVAKLRQRTDYASSVSTIGILVQRYAQIYSRSLEETIETVSDDVRPNPELDRALEKLWAFLGSFGDRRAWEGLQVAFNKVVAHAKKDPDFEIVMRDVGVALQKLLTDPDFFDTAEKQIDDLRSRLHSLGTESSFRGDLDDFIAQAKLTYESVTADKDVSRIWQTTPKLLSILSPSDQTINDDILHDGLHIFLPLLVSAIQYIPIPRIEVSVPELDLLIENLILEPGRTVNNSSFLPFRLRIETHNEVAITKARFRTHSTVGTLVRVSAEGLSLRADELGFWLRLHSGLFRLADEGIASFALDERGIDVQLEIEVGKECLEKILTLRAVRVTVHNFDYTLRKSKLSWLAWLAKPILRLLLKHIIERQVESAIEGALHSANRELVYARERLRATRVADPSDLFTFVRAVSARLTTEPDPDAYAGIGVVGGAKGAGPSVFRGVYAPGSLVKLWEDEARQASELVDDSATGRWRNEIFDVPVTSMH
ncbi:hypothetical protein AURDEDRAFT_71510 [Auricularia subglabra TFB-10046 SS5]|uniref:HAM1-like N-terminal domain-containing protein n=1 Tax=Auricularia subglabra (strain TFB-10046 / SS5) TaxID=717982 RepID=J0WVQ9_AURST|nr:hypothetical protein AURDEDRAFT_71510 [Auricularia subglabra TFB-10046 SS5]